MTASNDYANVRSVDELVDRIAGKLLSTAKALIAKYSKTA